MNRKNLLVCLALTLFAFVVFVFGYHVGHTYGYIAGIDWCTKQVEKNGAIVHWPSDTLKLKPEGKK